MSGQDAAIVLTVLAIGALVVWFDKRCLDDLARTPVRQLRYFDRRTWAVIIIVSFPIGPFLYLMYGRPTPR